MRPIAALRAGARALVRQWRTIAWLYLSSLLFALPAAIVFGVIVDRFVGHSMLAADFARRLDPALMMELVREQPDALIAAALAASITLGLWLLQSVYLGGGLLVVIVEPQRRATLRDLLEGGGRVFGRLLRLLPLGLVFVAVFGVLPLGLLHAAARRLAETWIDPRWIFCLRLAAIALGLVGLGLANAIYDLMRIECAQRGRPVLRAAWSGLRLGARQPHRLLAAYLPFVTLAWGVTALVSLIDVQITRRGLAAVVLAALLQQAASLLRAGLRVALAASETHCVPRQS